MRLLLAGGGTGGHLFPGVALAQHLIATDAEAEVLFVGTRRGIEARVLPELKLPLATVDISGFVGTGLAGKIRLLPQLVRSLRQSLKILDDFRPDVVVGVGGYASAPALVAARLRKIPFVIHEQNAWPGLTNRLLSPWADRIFLSFADADRAFHHGRTMLTGNPLRAGMEECPPIAHDNPTLLVFGGSRGARAINKAMCETLPLLSALRGRLRIVHQTGSEDLSWVQAAYEEQGWTDAKVVPFIDAMAEAYAQTHLVVCRAGATTIAELTACGRPAILIPFPFAAGDHQTANAQALVQRGAALALPQSEMTPQRLSCLVGDLLRDRERLLSMAASARSLSRPGAAATIIKECRALARRG